MTQVNLSTHCRASDIQPIDNSRNSQSRPATRERDLTRDAQPPHLAKKRRAVHSELGRGTIAAADDPVRPVERRHDVRAVSVLERASAGRLASALHD